MLHHLNAGEKESTLREVRRVLKPGGRFHLLDFRNADSIPLAGLTRFLHSRSSPERQRRRAHSLSLRQTVYPTEAGRRSGSAHWAHRLLSSVGAEL